MLLTHRRGYRYFLTYCDDGQFRVSNTLTEAEYTPICYVHHGQSQRVYVYRKTPSGIDYSLNGGNFQTKNIPFDSVEIVEIHGEVCYLAFDANMKYTLVRGEVNQTIDIVRYGNFPVSTPSGHAYIPTEAPGDIVCADSLSALYSRPWESSEIDSSYIWTCGGVWSIGTGLDHNRWVLRDPRMSIPHTMSYTDSDFEPEIIGANGDTVYINSSQHASKSILAFDLRNFAEYYIVDLGKFTALALVG